MWPGQAGKVVGARPHRGIEGLHGVLVFIHTTAGSDRYEVGRTQEEDWLALFLFFWMFFCGELVS